MSEPRTPQDMADALWKDKSVGLPDAYVSLADLRELARAAAEQTWDEGQESLDRDGIPWQVNPYRLPDSNGDEK